MKEFGPFEYHDRRTGHMKTDTIYAHRLIDWLYNSRLGWLLTRTVLNRRWVSRLYGWLYKKRWSRQRIRGFVKRMGIRLDEITQPLESFDSFNALITRRIDLSQRPLEPNPEVCVAPADGRVIVYPGIDAHRHVNIKRARFNLPTLLQNAALAATYDGGSLFITRLYLDDYHHFHFPDSGVAEEPVSIPGRYFTVSPYSRSFIVPFYTENHRMLTILNSSHFGQVAMIEVGAFTIGSIQQRFTPNTHVDKGAHKGFFELGGSVVILIFPKGAIRFDRDLLDNSAAGVETYVRMGESIGRGPNGHSPRDE